MAGEYRTLLGGVATDWLGNRSRSVIQQAGPWLVMGTIAIVYFQIYWHYWLIQLLGGYVINTLLPIGILLFAAAVFLTNEYVFLSGTDHGESSRLTAPMILLLCYVGLASSAVIINEEGVERVRAYLIYVMSPPLIFLGLLAIYRRMPVEAMEKVLWTLFGLAVGLSLYVASIYMDDSFSTLADMPEMETNRGVWAADTGASYAVQELGTFVKRFTIPGLSSTTYGPMMVPLVLVGWYFARNSRGRKRLGYVLSLIFLCSCIVMTVSRGPILALGASLLYLAWWRWISFTGGVFLAVVLATIFATFGLPTLIRTYSTIASFIPLDDLIPVLSWAGITSLSVDLVESDPHINSVSETMGLILGNPLFGIGRTRLAEFGINESPYGNEHNNYLSVAGSFGLPAGACYALFILTLLVLLHRRLRRMTAGDKSRDLGIVLVACMIAMIMYLNGASAEFHFIWIWFGLSAAWIARGNGGEELAARDPRQPLSATSG